MLLSGLAALSLQSGFALAADAPAGWHSLFETPPNYSWLGGGDVRLDEADPGRLVTTPGKGVVISTRKGSKVDRNLQTDELFGDIELRLEFLLAENSNAGVKMHGLYEIQLYDSHAIAEPKATHSGGIYPRASRKPSYHHIDEGTPPLKNAALPAGQWQTLAIRFRAPRFDDAGRKIASAMFEEVRLNGEVVQQMAVVNYPTGAFWRRPEAATGPVYLQGDHGPVAYRNVRVRPLAPLSSQGPCGTIDELRPSW